MYQLGSLHSLTPNWATSSLPLGLCMLDSGVLLLAEGVPFTQLGWCVAFKCSAHRCFACLHHVLVVACFLLANFPCDVGGIILSGPLSLLRADKWPTSLLFVNRMAGSTLSFSTPHLMGIVIACLFSVMHRVLPWKEVHFYIEVLIIKRSDGYVSLTSSWSNWMFVPQATPWIGRLFAVTPFV